MKDFQISIADLIVGISAEYTNTFRRCENYFVSSETEHFHVRVSREDLDREKIIFKERNSEKEYSEFALSDFRMEWNAVYRKIAEQMIDHDRILIHGSAIAVDGNAYLFLAPSGTGKSTHTRLWREMLGERAFMVNDDKPIIWVKEDQIIVYGTPWDGKHHLSTNIGVPLKGICRINRGTQNKIKKLSSQEGLIRLIEQTYRSSEPARVVHTMEMLGRITSRIPVFSLYCNMDPQAAAVAYEAMKAEVKNETQE